MSDDEEQYDPKSHKGLLQAISNLQTTQHIRKATRGEIGNQHDEFQLVKRVKLSTDVPKSNVAVNDVVQVLKKTKKHIDTGKLLKNVQSTKKVLQKPLEKTAEDRIRRTIAYEKTKKNLARWDAVVAKNRSAETQVFPLQSETIYVDTSAHAKPFNMSLKSELMLEMEASEAKLRALEREKVGDTIDEKEFENEKQRLHKKEMARQELIAKRKELAYLKMRESQKSAKARLQNKIKSKKYHKLMKRQKIQEQMKQFELLQKTNPEAALEKLNEIEKSRVLERASLRHKNTGTWAKNLQVRAKYDKDVRKDLAEQLQMSRQITQKKNDSDSEEDQESDDEIKKQDDEDFDPFNPWTKAQATKSDTAKLENDENWRKYWLERNENQKLLEEYKKDFPTNTDNEEEAEKSIEEQDEEEVQVISEKGRTIKNNKKRSKSVVEKTGLKIEKNEQKDSIQSTNKKTTIKAKKKVKLENGWVVEPIKESISKIEDSIDDIFDAKEEQIRTKLTEKLNEIAERARELQNKKTKKTKKCRVVKEKDALKNLKDLSFKQQATKPIIDEELNAEEINRDSITNEMKNITKVDNTIDNQQESAVDTPTQSDTIDPNKLATIKLKQNMRGFDNVNTIMDDVDIEGSDEDGEDNEDAQQMTIAEAFEDDDIVADFAKEKAADSEIKNTELQLSLPGWGAWAGAGISEELQAKRNKRLVLKFPNKEKRRDDNKNGVYINEEVCKEARKHFVSDLPFPFTTVKGYEASTSAPIGRNFVPETAFRMLTRPAVITKKGQIIDPMDESELIKPARRLRHVVDRRIERAAVKT